MKVIKFFSPLLGLLFPVVLLPIVVLLLIFFLIRMPWYKGIEGGRFFDPRDWGPNSHSRLSMNVEFSGVNFSPGWGVEFSGNGDHEHETCIQYWFIVSVFITVNNLFPKRWAPEYVTSSGEVVNWGTREYSFKIHHNTTWLLWWNTSGWAKHQGWMFTVDFAELIFGKIHHESTIWGYSYHNIIMAEGPYPCMVIRNQVRRGRSRWFTREYFTYGVVYGDHGDLVLGMGRGYAFLSSAAGEFDYILNKEVDLIEFEESKEVNGVVGVVRRDGEFVSDGIIAVFMNAGISMPGKGTCAHNCDDTVYYSWSGLAKNPYDAVLKAQSSLQKRRRDYGGEAWVPRENKYWEHKLKS